MRAESLMSGVGLDSIEGATLTNDDLNEINQFFLVESFDGSSSSAGEGRSRSTRANNTWRCPLQLARQTKLQNIEGRPILQRISCAVNYV